MQGNPSPAPRPENLTPWQPGQSGNPAGHSRGRRIAAAITRLIDEKGLEREIALTLIGMALGRRKMLRGRKPEYQWFRELLNRVDGPVGKDEDEGKIDWAELVPAAQARAMERKRQRELERTGP